MSKKMTLVYLDNKEDIKNYMPFLYEGDSFSSHNLIKNIRKAVEDDNLKNKIILFSGLKFLYNKDIAIITDENGDVKTLSEEEIEELIERIKRKDEKIITLESY